MSEISSTGAVVAGSKALWATVGVLGAAVVGLGGALYYTTQSKPAVEPVQAVAAVPVDQPAAVVAPKAEPALATTTAPVAKPKKAHEKKPAPTVAQPVPIPVAATPAPVVSPVPVAPVCADCATVASVTPVEREVQTSGTGAVAGGVLGALVGNQFGQGQGKDVATILGAIGGGVAGNQIEKKMKKVVGYQIELRMDDGRRRTLELDHPMNVGERVRFDGTVLQPLPAGRG